MNKDDVDSRAAIIISLAKDEGRALLLAEILGPNATPKDAAELARILEARHKGSERGELHALLVRLWGESPAITTQAERKIVRELGR